MQTKKLTFKNAAGHQLSALLDIPVNPTPVAVALFAHCFTCSKNLHAVRNISRALTGKGLAVLRFDFTGLGESEGTFSDTNFSSNVQDLICAADFLDHHYSAPQVLIGHSLGGAAVLQAASEITSSKAVVTIGAPCDPAHVTHLLGDKQAEIEKHGSAEVTLAGRSFRINKQFLDDLDMTRMKEKIKNLKRALLIFHSPHDDTVDIENARHIYQSALHPKSFVSLDHADHLLTKESDSTYVGEVLAIWVKKYLDDASESQERLKGEKGVVVVRTGSEHYYTDIAADGHPLVSDEPREFGGGELGPSPYYLLGSSLGACSTITVRMYADRKQWPLENVIVRIKHDKISAADCADCRSETGKVDIFEREFEFEGPLSDEQRQRLLAIADRCPVHRSLNNEIKIISRMKLQSQP